MSVDYSNTRPSVRRASPRPRPLSLRWAGSTDKGRVRPNNEDAFLAMRFDAREVNRLGKEGELPLSPFDFTFAVCDGMGGARAGEFASRIAVEKITALLPRAIPPAISVERSGFSAVLVELFHQIHHALGHLGQSYEECRGMETTLSLCWFTGSQMHFAHVGDTRIYHWSGNQKSLLQLTQDDTHVAWLLRHGLINEREARTHPRRNVLQKALGGENQFVTPQVGLVEVSRGDRFLICSDGLTEGLHQGLVPYFASSRPRLGRPASADANDASSLVRLAVRNDGRDNATALLVEIV